MEKINQKKTELEFQKALALEFVKEYCEQQNYSLKKLSCLYFSLVYNECGFYCYSKRQHEFDGLLTDMETLPQVILLIKFEDGKLEIEETQYTKAYLS